MKRISIVKFFILFTVFFGLCHAAANDNKQGSIYLATVDIVDNKTGSNINKKILTSPDCEKNIKSQSKNIEITGYVNSSYVYLVIDIEKGRYVSGNMFQNGKSTYINGEYVNGVLYVYDNKGKQYTVLSDNMNEQFFKCQDLPMRHSK